VQIRDFMVQLPNLDDLRPPGSLVTVDRDTSPGTGTALRGRLGGRLRLHDWHAFADVINVLLEVPTGLHFPEVEILGTYECLSLAVRLAEACGKSLVYLTYVVNIHGKYLRSCVHLS